MLMESEHNMAREDKEGSGMGKESMGSSPEFVGIQRDWELHPVDDALMDTLLRSDPEEIARRRPTRSWGIADEWSVKQPDPAIGAMVFLLVALAAQEISTVSPIWVMTAKKIELTMKAFLQLGISE
jgi:hypothetical protein